MANHIDGFSRILTFKELKTSQAFILHSNPSQICVKSANDGAIVFDSESNPTLRLVPGDSFVCLVEIEDVTATVTG